MQDRVLEGNTVQFGLVFYRNRYMLSARFWTGINGIQLELWIATWTTLKNLVHNVKVGSVKKLVHIANRTQAWIIQSLISDFFHQQVILKLSNSLNTYVFFEIRSCQNKYVLAFLSIFIILMTVI